MVHQSGHSVDAPSGHSKNITLPGYLLKVFSYQMQTAEWTVSKDQSTQWQGSSN